MDGRKKTIILGIIAGLLIVLAIIGLILRGRVKYEVVFDSDGGTNIESQLVKKNQVAKKPISPVKEGYTFIEWTYQNEKYDFNTKVTKNITLVAKWDANNLPDIETYLIKFDTAGGNVIANINAEKGTTLQKPSDPIKEGYVFKEWTLDGKTYDFNTAVTKDITLVAVWQEATKPMYKITFDTAGGSKVADQMVEENSKVKKPSNPTKEGYIFKEWTLDGKTYNFSTLVTKETKLVAKWEIKDYWTVTFDTKGGSKISAQNVKKGSKLAKPANPTKEDYAFKEWTLDGKTYNFDVAPTKDITLVATYTKVNYTVTFDTKGGNKISTQKVNIGSKPIKPANPTKSGYIFKEWTLNGNVYNFDTVLDKDVTLVATYTEKPKETFTISFNTDGGNSIQSQSVIEGNKATKPTNPTKTGYNFNGWTLNGKSYDFTSAVTGNITLTATWKQKSYSVVVSMVDEYSPERRLTAQEDGKTITVKNFKYSDGTTICSGSVAKVAKVAIEGETSFKLELSDGTIVTATRK